MDVALANRDHAGATGDVLAAYGWSPAWTEAFRPYGARGFVPGRVVTEQRGVCRVRTETADIDATIQRGFRRQAASVADYPAVGDWVALEPHADGSVASLRAVLPRSSAFLRKDADPGADAQVVAANVDVVFLVASMNADFNLRRLERYLALAWSSGAEPVVVLNKLDLCPDPGAYVGPARAAAGTAPVHALSAVSGEGLDGLAEHIRPGRTIALLGSSGVGKSTIVNSLLGWERQRTATIREDDARGRHTTTARELVPLPTGGVLLDTPGMRAVSLWDADAGLGDAFAEIAELAAACRFGDCRHETEPGCAVRAAISSGALPAERLQSQRKLERELRSLERRQSPAASRAASRRFGRMVRDASRDVMRLKGWEPD